MLVSNLLLVCSKYYRTWGYGAILDLALTLGFSRNFGVTLGFSRNLGIRFEPVLAGLFLLKAMPLYSSMPSMSKDMSNNSTNQQEAQNCPIVGSQGKEANCHISKQLVGRRVYQIDPIYDLYAASRDWKIIHIVKQDPISGNKDHNGYIQCCVRRYGGKNQKTYRVLGMLP